MLQVKGRYRPAVPSSEAPSLDAPPPGAAGGGRPRRVDRADALAAGMAAFQTGARLDVQDVAAQLGINRITLYRWVGTREAFLSEVMSELAVRTVRRAAAEADRVALPSSHAAHAVVRFVEASTAHPGVQRMWREEAALFTRLTAGEHSAFQARLVDAVRTLLAEDVTCRRVDLPAEGQLLDDIAFAVVRIAETFVHTRAITGGEPDASRCSRVLRTLLRPPA